VRIGLLVHSFGRGDLAGVVDGIRQAAMAGLHSAWLTEVYGLDALTALTVAGRDVPGIELGTAVVPTFPRHPIVLAGQALTTQAAVEGRLALGIGPSHRAVVEDILGSSYDRPVRHVREYLTVLRALVYGGTVDFDGETLRAATRLGPLRVRGASPFPILLAALGPRMVRVAGELADGTVTWLAGPRTLGQRIVPALEATAQAAGRPPPRVVVGLPVCVTNDEARARRRIGHHLAAYRHVPSYRAVLDEEGAAGPAGVALVGDEDGVTEQVQGLARLGVTDFLAYIVGSAGEGEATLRLLGRLARSETCRGRLTAR
jgi:F420-dependent oxidoreductase-like protein